MLEITVPLSESYNEKTGEFLIEGFQLQFEHSLVALSKWESHFKKPFLGREEKTAEETLFYIEKCMLLTKNPPGEILQKLSKKNYDEIQAYIQDGHTATTFNDPKDRPQTRQIITAHVIYGWMVNAAIPFEAQYWHLDDLFVLIRVVNQQKQPAKKMGRAEAARQQAQLNAQRRAQMESRG